MCCIRAALRLESWKPFIIFFSLTTFISCSLLAYDLVTDSGSTFWGVVGMSVQLVGTVVSMCLMPAQVRYGVRNNTAGSRRRWRPRRQNVNNQNNDQKFSETTTTNEEPPNTGQDVSISVMKSGDSSLDANSHNTQQQHRSTQGNQTRADGISEQSRGGGDTDSARPLISEQPEAGHPKIPNNPSTGVTPTVPAHA